MSARVIIRVRGGMVQDVYLPAGVRAVVYDYDNDGDQDEDGEPCSVETWTAPGEEDEQ